MKQLFLVLFSIILPLLSWADSPPCYCKFKTVSENGHYFAWVDAHGLDTIKEPWNADWKLTVYKKSGNDSTIVWKTDYDNSGYPSGTLSNDGLSFFYINDWYAHDYGVVVLYRDGRKVGQVYGKEFKLKYDQMQSTVSHHLWLKKREIVPNKGHYDMILYTMDGKVHLVSGVTAKLD